MKKLKKYIYQKRYYIIILVLIVLLEIMFMATNLK